MQSIQLDSDAFKLSSGEASKVLYVSLNQIDTYRSDGVITILIGQKKYSGGGGVT